MVRFRFGRFAIALASVSDLDQAMFYYRLAAPTGRLSPPFGFRLSYQTDSHSLILVVGFRSIFNVLLRVPRMVLGFGVFDPGLFRFIRFPSCTVLCWWRGAFNPIAAFRVIFLRKLHAVVFSRSRGSALLLRCLYGSASAIHSPSSAVYIYIEPSALDTSSSASKRSAVALSLKG